VNATFLVGNNLKPTGNGQETAAGQNTGGLFVSGRRLFRLPPLRLKVTRELGRKISSIRIMRRPISYALVMACFVPVAYADVRPDTSEAMTAAAEVHPQDTAATPKPSSALETARPSSAVPSSAVPSSAVPLDEAVEDLLPDYSKLTHHQLTRIGARWDQLGDSERRGLLNEVKLRMARQKGSERTLRIRTQRRYGRIVRRSDGQVLRIETKVIQVAPVRRNPTERSFGVGFERRHAEPDPTSAGSVDPGGELAGSEDAPGAPARRVNDNKR
jgi:hypothetical protein